MVAVEARLLDIESIVVPLGSTPLVPAPEQSLDPNSRVKLRQSLSYRAREGPIRQAWLGCLTVPRHLGKPVSHG